MNIKWRDGSSYSRDDKDRVPNVWHAIVGILKISVVYNHVCYPDQWVFSCEPFFEHEELGNITPTEAQERALGLVRLALEKTLIEFNIPSGE